MGGEVGVVAAFWGAARAGPGELATSGGDLYFELHRGTYTSQSRTKRLNRQAQRALKEAEMWSVAAGEYPQGDPDAPWKTPLLNQIHHILPGSPIHSGFQDAARGLSGAIRRAPA